jgi:hypothetical protein
LLQSARFAPVNDWMFIDASEAATLCRPKRFQRTVIVSVNRFDLSAFPQTSGDVPIQGQINSIHAENPCFCPGEELQTQLLGQEPARLTPGNRSGERFNSIGKRTAPKFVAKARRQVALKKAALFPIQARPEFRQQIIFSKSQRGLAHVLIGGRMRKQDHGVTV